MKLRELQETDMEVITELLTAIRELTELVASKDKLSYL
jgi:hypothetical protein